MHVFDRKRWVLALCFVLVMALAVPAGAFAKTSRSTSVRPHFIADDADGNGDIPTADPIAPGSTVITGTLEASSDNDDVFELDLLQGDKFSVKLDSVPTGEFLVALFNSGTTSIDGTGFGEYVAVADDPSGTSAFTYYVPADGKYYLDVGATNGTGTYTVELKIDDVEADDQLPGVPLPSSPATGELELFGDIVDAYSVNLTAGDTFRAVINANPAETFFDLALFDIGATDVFTDVPRAITADDAYPIAVKSTVTTTGTYYLAAQAYGGDGAYDLTWEIGKDSAATLAGPSVVNYGSSFTLSGKVSDVASATGVAALPVTIQRRYPGTFTWTDVVTVGTNGSGVFSKSLTQTRKTQYRAVYAGNGTVVGGSSNGVTVNNRAALTTPSAPKRIYKNKYFTTVGTFKPRPNSGRVYVKAYNWSTSSRKWILKKTYTARVTMKYAGTSYYSAKVRATSRGKWKFVAYAPSSDYNYYTYSSARYKTAW